MKRVQSTRNKEKPMVKDNKAKFQYWKMRCLAAELYISGFLLMNEDIADRAEKFTEPAWECDRLRRRQWSSLI
jgi:hypothetical protein